MKDQVAKGCGENIVVSKKWFDYVMKTYERLGCPFCFSQREPAYDPGDEKFESRQGCLDCDNWWGEKELRK